MPHILNLANEVLFQIIAATNPYDVESFAASCKRINILAQPELKRHRQLKRKYAKLAFSGLGNSVNAPGIHPIYVLRDILQDTALAQYPTTIRSGLFDNNYPGWRNTDQDIVEVKDIRAAAAGCDRDVRNAIKQCPFIKTQERETWRVQIKQGRGPAIFGLLLSLLPNLTSMVVEPQPEGLFTQILKRIVESQQLTHRLGPQALTKLAEMDTRAYCSESNMTVHQFDYLSLYALLPSMRTITGSYFKTGVSEDAQTFQWRHDPGTSAVTAINIDCSMVNADSITNLVRGVRALERFGFSFSDRMPTRVVYQPRKIIRGLELYTKCSLSYLHLTGTRIRINTMQDDDLDDDLEIDLRVFEKLKQLRIDHTLLSHHGRPCLAPFKKKPDEDCNCWPQRLVDALPASLESLEVMDYVPWKHAKAFFAGFLELKTERLPRLREIEMQGGAAAGLELVHLCEKVGVILGHDGVDDNENYQCS